MKLDDFISLFWKEILTVILAVIWVWDRVEGRSADGDGRKFMRLPPSLVALAE